MQHYLLMLFLIYNYSQVGNFLTYFALNFLQMDDEVVVNRCN